MSCKTVLLLQVSIQEIERFCELGRTVLESLFEQVPCAFKFCAPVAGEEFCQVEVPEFKGDGVTEVVDPSFVDTKGFFVVALFFEEVGVVYDYLGGCDTEFEDSFVDFLGGFDGPDTFFQVDIK